MQPDGAGADSGDADEDEGAEAPGGFLCLVVVEMGQFLVDVVEVYRSHGGYTGAPAELGAESEWSRDGAEGAYRRGVGRGGGGGRPNPDP